MAAHLRLVPPPTEPKPRRRRKAKRKPKVTAANFQVPWALDEAARILAAPRAKPHIIRIPPNGDLVARFVLPLELCKPQNATRHAPVFLMQSTRKKIQRLMWIQHLSTNVELRCPQLPLEGRPLVRCVRFSSAEPDKYNDGFKMAIDYLCSPKRSRKRRKEGLGILHDDRPGDTEIHQWWEKAAPGAGFGMIDVWTNTGDDHGSNEKPSPGAE